MLKLDFYAKAKSYIPSAVVILLGRKTLKFDLKCCVKLFSIIPKIIDCSVCYFCTILIASRRHHFAVTACVFSAVGLWLHLLQISQASFRRAIESYK